MNNEYQEFKKIQNEFDFFMRRAKDKNAFRREPKTLYAFVDTTCEVMNIPKDTFAKVFDGYVKEGKLKLRKPFHFKPTAIINQYNLRVNSPNFKNTFMEFEFDDGQVSSFSYSLPMAGRLNNLPLIDNLKSKITFGCLQNCENFSSEMKIPSSVVSKQRMFDLIFLHTRPYISPAERMPKKDDVRLALQKNGAEFESFGEKFVYTVEEQEEKITLTIKRTSPAIIRPTTRTTFESVTTYTLTPFHFSSTCQIKHPSSEAVRYHSYIDAGICPTFKELNAIDRMTKEEYLTLTGKDPDTEKQIREVLKKEMRYDSKCRTAREMNKIYGTNYQPEETEQEKAERIAQEEKRAERLERAGKPRFSKEELDASMDKFRKMIEEVDAKKAEREAKLKAQQVEETKNSENEQKIEEPKSEK